MDANALVRASARSEGPARELLDLIRQEQCHVLVVSRYLLAEVRRALGYPRLQAIYGLSDQDIEEHIRLLEEVATIVEPTIAELVVRRDPADDPIVHAAVEGRVDVLCTKDRAFYDPDVIAYCGQRGIQVMDDVDLLHELRSREYGPER